MVDNVRRWCRRQARQIDQRYKQRETGHDGHSDRLDRGHHHCDHRGVDLFVESTGSEIVSVGLDSCRHNDGIVEFDRDDRPRSGTWRKTRQEIFAALTTPATTATPATEHLSESELVRPRWRRTPDDHGRDRA